MMIKTEVIIELGAEGGSITVYGIRTEQGWVFSRRVDDYTPELIGEVRVQKNAVTVDSWEAVLGLLDQYPWHRLFPIIIHRDFKERILVAVQQRMKDNDQNPELVLKRWRDCCQ